MSKFEKPKTKPKTPFFSSGPCAKRPGWHPDVLAHAARWPLASIRRGQGETEARRYENARHPASASGLRGRDRARLRYRRLRARDVESAGGARGVDVLAWDVFGRNWLRDATAELKLHDLRTFEAEAGHLPDLGKVDFSRDVLFTWNGTTTGVRVPNADWIADDREGLVFCDATSALFAEEIDLLKIDVLTYSWQKALGGEGAHGMLIVSPRALDRLASYRPPWPVPKLFRLTNNDGILRDVFEGVTLNTPSMLCVEDYLDALQWAESIGGLDATIARARANSSALYGWISRTAWIAPLAVDEATRSHTSVAMRFTEPALMNATEAVRLDVMRGMVGLLEAEGAAFDIAAYRGMPAGLRIWCGTTVETEDIVALLPWLEWAYAEARLGVDA